VHLSNRSAVLMENLKTKFGKRLCLADGLKHIEHMTLDLDF
jgi:hypothetical protein